MLGNRWFWILWAGLLFITAIFWKQREDKTVIWSDVEGYYLYLPATFIYGFEEIPVNTHSEFSKGTKGIVYTRFSYGVALFEAPFFLLTHAVCTITGYHADGYSLPYQWTIYAAMAFYLALGCCILYKVLRRFASPWPTRIVIAALVLGTDLFHFSLWGGAGHSHTIQFMLMAALLYVSPMVWEDKRARWSWFFISALMTLIRIPHLCWVLLPLFYGLTGLEMFRDRIITAFKGFYWLAFLLVLGLVMFPQLYYYKMSLGRWLVNAYAPDGHMDTFPYLGSPRLLRVLFDVRNGLFVYAPVLFLCIPGVFILWKRGYRGFVLGSLFLLSVLWWTLGAWNMYWLGGLGHRGFIDVFPLLAIFMAVFVEGWKNYTVPAGRWVLQTIMLLTVFLGLGFNVKYDFPWQPPKFGWEDYRVVITEIFSLDWSPYQPNNRPQRMLHQEFPID